MKPIFNDQPNQQPNENQNQQLNVNLSEIPFEECEECGCTTFQEKIMIKRISKFLTGKEQDSIAPVPVIACASCNHVNKLFKPNL